MKTTAIFAAAIAAALFTPALASAAAPCVETHADTFECEPYEDGTLDAFEDAEITIVVGAEPGAAGPGWDCDSAGWCTMDYGAVTGDDEVEAPSGGMTCPDSPASCPGQGPPRKIWIKLKKVDLPGG